MASMMNAFHDSTYEKYIFRHIKHCVEVAKESYKRDLDGKRQRLKQLLETEDLAYENEFRIMVQGRLEETIRQRQEKLLKIRNEKINQNKEFLARKTAQRLIENSDDIRTMLSHSLLRETKACNLAQIEEKKRFKAEADQMELLWLNVRDKNLIMDDQRQKYEETIRKKLAGDDQTTILQQMALRNSYAKEDTSSEYISGGTGSLFYKNESEEEKQALQRQKNIQNQKEMLHHQQIRQKLLDENCEAENRFIETINQQVEEEIRKERERLRIKPKTAEIFLGYCNEIKQEREKNRNAEIDSILVQQAEYDCKNLREYKKRQEKLQNLGRKTHDILLGQIDYIQTKRHNETIMQNEQNIAEDELLLRDIEQIKQKENEKLAYNKLYEGELKAQANEYRRRQLEQKCKDVEETKRLIEHSIIQDDVAKQLITEDGRFLKSHPNWKLMGCSCKNPQ